MTTRATTRATTRSTTRGINAAKGVNTIVWTPASLATLRQWLSDNYYSSPVGGLQVIESLETHGTVRTPQPGACALFDGTNDKANHAGIALGTTHTLSFWAKGSMQNAIIIGGSNDNEYGLYYSSGLFYYSNGGFVSFTGTQDVGAHHYCIVRSGTSVSLYIDGAQVDTTKTLAANTAWSLLSVGAGTSASFNFGGQLWDLRVYSTAKTAPEVAAIAACDFTNLDTTGIIAGWYLNDRAGTTARDWSGNGHDLTLSGPITEATFWAEDSSITANPANVLGYTLSGSTVIPRDESDPTKDVQGNALGNTGLSPYPVTIDTPCIAFSGTDYATNNDFGTFAGSLSALTVSFWMMETIDSTNDGLLSIGPLSGAHGPVLARLTATNIDVSVDAFASFATFAKPGVDVPVFVSFTYDGTNLKLFFDGVEKHSIAVSGAVNCTGQKLALGAYFSTAFSVASQFSRLLIHSVAKTPTELLAMTAGYDDRVGILGSWKCQEGPGTASDNVTLYDDSGNGNHLTVVGGTVADQWDNLCPGYVRDHAFDVGGRLDALGAFCPLVPSTLLCADGNAPTIAAGNITGNPYSRVDFDPFDAAELGALAVPGEFDSLPCVTGNGTNNNIELGSDSFWDFPDTGFEVELDVMLLADGSANIFCKDIQYQIGFYLSKLYFWISESAGVYIGRFVNAGFGLNTWRHLKFVYSGGLNSSGIEIWIDGVRSDTTDFNLGTYDGMTLNASTALLLGSSPGLGGPLAMRVSNAKFTNVTTKYFPLTDGSGDDIAMYEDGVATIISNAIQGTLTNVWANKTDGQVDHEFPEAVRAIVPRDTKFTNGSTKTITTSEAATGADLTNILDYIG